MLNQSGEVMIAAQYDLIASSLSGKAYIAMKGDKYLLLDNTGKVLSDGWDFIGEGSVGMFEVAKDGRYGYINESGEVILKPQYYYVTSIGDNLALVGKGKRTQLLDIQSGCVIIDMAGSWKK